MMYLGDKAVGLNHIFTQIGSAAKIETGIYIPTDSTHSSFEIQHSLGSMPDFILYWTESSSTASTISQPLYGVIMRVNSSTISGTAAMYLLRTNGQGSNGTTSGTATQATAWMNDTIFKLICTSSSTFQKDQKYYYVIGKFNTQEVTPNA